MLYFRFALYFLLFHTTHPHEMPFTALRELIQAKELQVERLREQVIHKHAYLHGLPPLDVCHLQSPKMQYLRLSDPKRDGKSLKKKQCDLWEFCWGAGALLAKLTSQIDLFTNKSLLELGGGIGLASLAILSQYKVSRCVMTDLVPDALRVFELSTTLLLKQQQQQVETAVLNWNRPEDYFCFKASFDVVFGSDVLFMSWCAPLVAKICASSLTPQGLVLVLDPFRLNDGLFLECLEREGLCYAKSFVFDENVIAAVAQPLQDKLGSFVPVKRAKLLIASRLEIDSDVVHKLLKIEGLTEE